MEHLLNSQKTITYKSGYEAPSSSYIVRRNKTRVIPLTGSSTYTPKTTRRISWRLPAEWTDMNDLFFTFKLKEKTTGAPTTIVLQGGAHALFQRLRITIGGVVAEDINNINVLEQLIHKTTGNDDLVNSPLGKIAGYSPARGEVTDVISKAELTAGFELCWKPKVSGILSNDKILPLPYLPECVIELYLSDVNDVLQITGGTTPTVDYEISDVSLNCDTIEYDSEFVQAFESSLNNSPLNYYFTTFNNFNQSVSSSTDMTIGSFRTDIKSIFAVARDNTKISSPNDSSYEFIRAGSSRKMLYVKQMIAADKKMTAQYTSYPNQQRLIGKNNAFFLDSKNKKQITKAAKCVDR
eukprot:Awhi_evm6s1128